MTAREQAVAALAFQPTDRIPMLGGCVANAEFLRQVSGLDPRADPRRPSASLGVNRLAPQATLSLSKGRAPIEAAKGYGANLVTQVVGPKPAKASTLGPNLPPENLWAVVEHCREYGRKRLGA